jgi:hypothetical protein
MRRRARGSAASYHSVGLSSNTKATDEVAKLLTCHSIERQNLAVIITRPPERSEGAASGGEPRRRGHRVPSALPDLARLRHPAMSVLRSLSVEKRTSCGQAVSVANDPMPTFLTLHVPPESENFTAAGTLTQQPRDCRAILAPAGTPNVTVNLNRAKLLCMNCRQRPSVHIGSPEEDPACGTPVRPGSTAERPHRGACQPV